MSVQEIRTTNLMSDIHDYPEKWTADRERASRNDISNGRSKAPEA